MRNLTKAASLTSMLLLTGCWGSSDSSTITPESSSNKGPVLEQITTKQIESGDSFSYQLVVSDPDDSFPSDFTFEVIKGPEGLSINENGVLSFISSTTASKNNSVTIQVKDGGENNAQPSRVTFSLSELYYLTASGNLINYYTNQAISNGEVQLSINGVVINKTVSQENGEFSLKYLDTLTYSNAVISADAPGYSEASISLIGSEIDNTANLYLPPIQAEVIFNAAEENVLKVNGFPLIFLRENSFVDANGEVVSGNITSELFIIDPTLDIDLMPGEMITQSGEDPMQLVPIESFGAIAATFRNEAGETLQLGADKTAEIHIPVSGVNPPNTIPLYYYDDINGVWVEEGEATLISDISGDYYLGNVSHFTTWNADRVYETVNINGCVEDIDGTRIVDARISTEGHDYNGRSNAFSDIGGYFTVPVKTNSSMFISASNNHQSRTITVTTASTDFTMNECLVLDKATSKIELKWGLSPTDLDSHFYGPSTNGERFHIAYYNDSEIVNGVNMYLDVDDINSYGPEVITIPKYNLPGTYQYFVHNFSGDADIQPAETRVELIINEQRTSFTPPDGVAQIWWHVFDIVVQESGSMTVNTINTWSLEPDNGGSLAISSRNKSVKTSINASQLHSKYYAK
jgi:hypothetical protein